MKPIDTESEPAAARILIVEDEIIIARELEARLQGMEYEVVGIASSGREAIELAEEAQPDLVLMDIVLKGDIDGIEAAEEIRRRLRLPVIFVSAYTDPETLRRAKITEPFAYIVKPFSERELGANIEIALYRHRMESRVRKLEDWFASAMEQVPEAVIAADLAGRVTVLNRAAEDITEWTKEEAMGRSLGDVFRLVGGDGSPVALGALAEGPMVCLANEAKLLDKSGRSIPVDSSISYVRDVGGHPAGIVAIVRDVTGQRHSALVAMNRDVALAATQALTLRGMLQICCESIVRHLNAAFARIWTVDPSGADLLLQASAGLYTHLDGPHGRVPIGNFKIGRIAEQREPHLTNDVLNDPLVSDPEWARREGMAAFAGYPLLVGDRLVGVLAMFSRRALPDTVIDALGSVARSVAVAVERKQSEESLLATQARLQHVLSVSPAVIYTLTLDGDRVTDVWVSENIDRMLGYAQAECDTRWWEANIHPDDLKMAIEEMPEILRLGALTSEYRFRDRDGTYHWIRDEKRVDRDAHGRPIECVGSWTDISTRKDAEAAQQESENRLQQIAETSSAVLWLRTAGNLECLYVSPAYEAIWRSPCRSLYEDPESWMIPIHPDDAGGVRADLARAVEGESVTLRYRLMFPDGATRFIEDQCLPIRGADGAIVRLAGYAVDVTQRHELEEQYRHAQKMEAVGQLAGGVAHDFNNLLTVINGCSDIVMDAPGLDAVSMGLLAEIGKAGQRAAALTRQLLAFSRNQVLEPRLLDLNALVVNQQDLLCRLIGEDIVLTTLLDPGVDKVKADPGQLEQVIANLAVNARHAMPEGGSLTLETANVELDQSYVESHADVAAGDYVMLAVSDTGCGMTPEVKARIFEPFFTTKGPTEGTGLGLATVYGIIKQSGGHVAAYSELGMGTTFKIYLPRVKAARGAEATESAGVRTLPEGSETILLVEDEDAVRAVARFILDACGYQVLDADSGAEALHHGKLHEGPIHLLITDVVMPEIPGRALAEQFVMDRPDTRVLYMSGYTDDAVIRHGVLHAEMPFLQKPFTPFALAAKVREVLDQAPKEPRLPE